MINHLKGGIIVYWCILFSLTFRMFMKLMGHRSKASNVVNTKVVGPIHRWKKPPISNYVSGCIPKFVKIRDYVEKNPGILKPANIVVMNSCDTPFKITPKRGIWRQPIMIRTFAHLGVWTTPTSLRRSTKCRCAFPMWTWNPGPGVELIQDPNN